MNKGTGERREQILEVALALFKQYGMINVTTRQIARAVGISQPSLYAHFPNADAIAGELCVRGFRMLTAQSLKVLEQPGTPLERLERLGRAYIEFGLANPDIYRVACMIDVDPARVAPDPDPGMSAGIESYLLLRGVVEEILGPGDDRVETITQVCWTSVHGVVSLLLARDYFPWVDRETLISTQLRCVNAGVAALAAAK